MSGTDRRSPGLGTEDNRAKALADKKAYETIFVFVCLSVVSFFIIASGLNRSDRLVYAIKRGSETSSYSLRAHVKYEGKTYTQDVEITVNPENYSEALGNSVSDDSNDLNDWIEDFIQSAVNTLEKDNSGKSLQLPSEIDGVKVSWILPEEEPPSWIFALCLFVCVFVYFSRYDELTKQEKKYKNDVIYELPNMLRQLILLLNAGLVADAAFMQLYEQNKDNPQPFYAEYKKIYEKSVSDNSPFASNLYAYALNFGSRELIRFATLVYEHKGRGSELAGKLEAEGNLQYENRLSMARARAKEAETKLCFPLVLLLISLVIICIAPAMFDV